MAPNIPKYVLVKMVSETTSKKNCDYSQQQQQQQQQQQSSTNRMMKTHITESSTTASLLRTTSTSIGDGSNDACCNEPIDIDIDVATATATAGCDMKVPYTTTTTPSNTSLIKKHKTSPRMQAITTIVTGKRQQQQQQQQQHCHPTPTPVEHYCSPHGGSESCLPNFHVTNSFKKQKHCSPTTSNDPIMIQEKTEEHAVKVNDNNNNININNNNNKSLLKDALYVQACQVERDFYKSILTLTIRTNTRTKWKGWELGFLRSCSLSEVGCEYAKTPRGLVDEIIIKTQNSKWFVCNLCWNNPTVPITKCFVSLFNYNYSNFMQHLKTKHHESEYACVLPAATTTKKKKNNNNDNNKKSTKIIKSSNTCFTTTSNTSSLTGGDYSFSESKVVVPFHNNNISSLLKKDDDQNQLPTSLTKTGTPEEALTYLYRFFNEENIPICHANNSNLKLFINYLIDNAQALQQQKDELLLQLSNPTTATTFLDKKNNTHSI